MHIKRMDAFKMQVNLNHIHVIIWSESSSVAIIIADKPFVIAINFTLILCYANS